ncbi:MAG: NfeD family protein [Hyphomicrobiales bacterium]|nr:NfeD family protein [Hyphomicrobiales bacterium]
MDSIVNYLSEEPGWIWLIIAATLFTLDVLAPGFFMIWFALAAVVTGALVFLIPIDTVYQVLIFCAASIGSLALGRAAWGGRREDESDRPLLNQRTQQLVGRTYKLATPIQGGKGRILAGDGLWSVRGPDLLKGELVKVIGADGTELLVVAASDEAEQSASEPD